MEKILITGSTGLIGSALCKKLSSNYNVIGIASQFRNRKEIGFDFQRLDLRKEGATELLTSLSPTLIIHCAANIPSGDVMDSIDLASLNQVIDGNVLDAVVKLKCSLIYFSTTLLYEPFTGENEIDETYPRKSKSEYARQKIDSENFISENIENALILRVNAPYGAKTRHETVLTRFIKNANQNLPLSYYGSGARTQDFTHVDDIALMIHGLIERKQFVNGIFNISSGTPISMKDLAKLVVKTLNSNSEILESEIEDSQELYRANYKIEKARLRLNWEPKVSLEEGVLKLSQLI